MSSFRGEREAAREEAAEKERAAEAKAKKAQALDAHLKVLSHEQVEDDKTLAVVVSSALRRDGLPWNPEAFVSKCEAIAQRIVSGRRRREWLQAQRLLKELDAYAPSEQMLAAAKRVGVELPAAPPEPVQAPKPAPSPIVLVPG